MEVPMGGLAEPSVGVTAVRTIEGEQRGESLRRQGNRRGCAQHENSAGSRPPVQFAQNINGSFHGCAPSLDAISILATAPTVSMRLVTSRRKRFLSLDVLAYQN